MSRMILRLTKLGLSRRLTWAEVADIDADHQADRDAAVDQAHDDHARFSRSAAEDARFRAIYALLLPRDPE
jgi:hypothetical protein